MAIHRSPSARRALLIGVPVVVVALSLLATVLIKNNGDVSLANELRTDFAYRSRDALNRIHTRLEAYEQALIDVRGLFAADQRVDRTTFARFVANMNLSTRYPGIQGIGFAQWLPEADLAAHQASIRSQGFPDYEVFPPGSRAAYTAIVYLEPFAERNLRAFGYDMYSEPIRRRAMDRAVESGAPALSGKVKLVQETETNVQAGFLLYVPVYKPGTSDTVSSRRANLLGWVYAPFRVGDFMRGVLGEAEGDLDLEVYDGTTTTRSALMYDRDALLAMETPGVLQEYRTSLFGGQAWTIVTRALPGLVDRHGQSSSLVLLLMGVLASILAGLAIFLLLRQVDQVQRQNEVLEEGVRERTVRLAGILEGTNVGTWEWNIVTGETIFNERWANMVGYTLEELQPVSIQTWMTLAHPDDLKVSGELLEAHFEGRSGYYDFESRMKHKDGSWVWVHDRGAIATRTPDGKPLMMRGTHTDITQKRRALELLARSEQQWASLFRILPTGVLLTNSDGHIIEVNPAAQEILGLSRAEALARTDEASWWNLIRPDGTPLPLGESPLARATSEARAILDVELGLVRGDGALRWLVVSAIPVPVAGLGVTVAFVDITERKTAEALNRELEARNHQLQKRESLTLMAGSIAHHFNNRLQTVLNNLELARRDTVAELPLRHLTQARLSTEGAAEVSRMLLVYLGQSVLPHESTSLSHWLQNHRGDWEAVLPTSIHLECTESAGEFPVLANQEELQHVVTLLVENAAEAIGGQGGRIHLAVGVCASTALPTQHLFPENALLVEGEYTYLEVSDSGCGIPDADLNRLFDPFFSTKDTRRGLGLSVVLGVMQSLGGLVAVSTSLGHGSSFRLFFPPQPLAPHDVGTGEPLRETGRKILLVDDDDLLLDSACELLEMMDFEVLKAGDGLEALEVYRSHQREIGCVVTDLSMPRLDGWGLLEALRQADPALPVLMASGYDRAQVLSGTHSSEPQAFLSKPFNLDQLRTELDRYLAPVARGE